MVILYGQDQNDQWLVIDKCTVKDMEGKVVSDWMYHGYERYLIPIKEIKGLVVHYSESSELVPKGLLESRVEAQKKASLLAVENKKIDTINISDSFLKNRQL